MNNETSLIFKDVFLFFYYYWTKTEIEYIIIQEKKGGIIMENIIKKLNKHDEEEKINQLSNQLIVNLTIKCPEGTFDISRMLYQIPNSILKKEKSEYTDEDIKVLQHLEKARKTTKTIAKTLLPEVVLKEIKDIQYEVRKFYMENVLMPSMPLMDLNDFNELKDKIRKAEGEIKNLQINMERLWDDNLEQFEEDLKKAYPDAPEENIQMIMKKARNKKFDILGRQGFKLKVMVCPSANGIVSPELKKIMAEQSTDTMRLILEEAIKESFENVSNVYLLAQGEKNYLIHGKTRKRIPEFPMRFSKKMSVIGAKNYKPIKKVQNKLNLLTDKEYVIDDEKTVNLCGEITYLLIQIANDNNVELNIPETLDVSLLELKYDDLSDEEELLSI